MMDRWQLGGYRGGRIAGTAPAFSYGGRDPLSAIRGGLPLPDRGLVIGMGVPIGGLPGFSDPFARRRGGRFPIGQGIPRPAPAPYLSGHGLSGLRPIGREIDPGLALAPGRRWSNSIDPLYYPNYGGEADCDVCRLKISRGGLHDHDPLSGYCNCSGSGSGSSSRNDLSHRHRHGHGHNHHKHHNNGLSAASSSFCSSNPNLMNGRSTADFKTKDIAVRGKTYTTRTSYLAEAPKFEAELQKYVDKKSKEIIPDHVINMLISFINFESYNNDSMLDEVTLNVLASNIAAKSAFEHSLSNLKHSMDWDISDKMLSEICATVLCSDKVDDKLKDWLKDYLDKVPERVVYLAESQEWQEMRVEMPEVEARLRELMGLKKPVDEKNHRIM